MVGRDSWTYIRNTIRIKDLSPLLILSVIITCGLSSPNPGWRYPSYRSGGFPKFPVYGSTTRLSECGTRSVSHQPLRGGIGPTAKIVGGTSAPYGAYPWQVELQVYRAEKKGFAHHCGGAVVGERLVLTAAHCITNVDRADHVRLIVGKHNLHSKDKHERTYRVEKVAVHPDFRKDGPHSNDIALIKVKPVNDAGIYFNSYVQPICLPDPSFDTATEGEWCVVSGWGAQKPEDSGSLSTTLRAASVPLLPQSTCRQDDVYGGRHQSILDSMLCAGLLEGGVDACGGDSGGPLACQANGKFVLAGVVSWGDGCAKRNRPGVYTRVAHFVPWIRKASAKMGVS